VQRTSAHRAVKTKTENCFSRRIEEYDIDEKNQRNVCSESLNLFRFGERGLSKKNWSIGGRTFPIEEEKIQ